MPIQDITLLGLLLRGIPLKRVAVTSRYTALSGLIRLIHQMARHSGEQIQPPTILYQEVSMLETRVTFVKFNKFFAGLSLLFDLLAAESHILSAYSISARMYIATLTSLSVAISLFSYEISRSPEALSLHIADILQSGR